MMNGFDSHEQPAERLSLALASLFSERLALTVYTDLTVDEVKAILQTLVYDARIEQRVRNTSGVVDLDAATYSLLSTPV